MSTSSPGEEEEGGDPEACGRTPPLVPSNGTGTEEPVDVHHGFVLKDPCDLWAMLYEDIEGMIKIIENRPGTICPGWHAVSYSKDPRVLTVRALSAFRDMHPNFPSPSVFRPGHVHGLVRIGWTLPHERVAHSRWAVAGYPCANIITEVLPFCKPGSSVANLVVGPRVNGNCGAFPLKSETSGVQRLARLAVSEGLCRATNAKTLHPPPLPSEAKFAKRKRDQSSSETTTSETNAKADRTSVKKPKKSPTRSSPRTVSKRPQATLIADVAPPCATAVVSDAANPSPSVRAAVAIVSTRDIREFMVPKAA